MRLGGFRKDSDTAKNDNHEELELPFKNGRIQEIYSDGEWVYLILNDDRVIASGWTDVNFSGDLKLGVKFTKLLDYDLRFFESSSFSKLIVGSDNWSKAELE